MRERGEVGREQQWVREQEAPAWAGGLKVEAQEGGNTQGGVGTAVVASVAVAAVVDTVDAR